jgi:starch synthase/alpha-amylase
MPSRFEPCGLPQMIGCLYGALPVAHDTGGLHDTIAHMNVDNNSGNGFLFEVYDANGLWWAIEQAMHFYDLPLDVRRRQVERVMHQSASTFNHARTARQYMDLYEKMLDRPLIANPAGRKRPGVSNT